MDQTRSSSDPSSSGRRSPAVRETQKCPLTKFGSHGLERHGQHAVRVFRASFTTHELALSQELFQRGTQSLSEFDQYLPHRDAVRLAHENQYRLPACTERLSFSQAAWAGTLSMRPAHSVRRCSCECTTQSGSQAEKTTRKGDVSR